VLFIFPDAMSKRMFVLSTRFFPLSRVQFGKHIPDDEYLIAQPGAYLSHVGDVDVGTFSMVFSP
jgi:hypothetical protein